jgi:flavin reductase (DIM6/NTAB) family NADH-FMN oxidoreductase RutF
MTANPMWDDHESPAPPYPGWMPEDEGHAYVRQVGEQFRTAMSALAATVCVVAASSPSGMRTGTTATAVCSLSTEPPQLVACLNRESSIARMLACTGWFSVNILAGQQEDVASVFAGRGGLKCEARFAETEWSRHVTGVPLLTGAAASVVCHVAGSLHQASHLVLIGRVLDVLMPEGTPPAPLMYHLRRFTTVSEALASTRSPAPAPATPEGTARDS